MDPGRAPLRVFLAHPLNASWPCRCHADYFVLHGTFSSVQIVLIFIGFLARPKRFELLTPRFVVWGLHLIIPGYVHPARKAPCAN